MKTISILKISLVFSLTILLFSCKKEELISKPYGNFNDLGWQIAGCNESFVDQPGFGSISTGNQYIYPTFRSNSPYEFICYKIVKDSGSTVVIDHQIIKYNLMTRQETVILTNTEVRGGLAWNKDGWIAFLKDVGVFIHIVKDDGSQLTKFSNYPYGHQMDFNLKWVNNGNTLLWGGVTLNGQNFLKTKTVGDNVEKLMELDDAMFNEEFTISSKNIMLSPVDQDQQVYYITDLNEAHLSTTNIQYNLQTGLMFGRANWHVDGERFYVGYYENNGSAGFYEINYMTGAITKLIDLCHKMIIKEAVCMPDGKHLILQKVEREVIVGQGMTYGNGLIENYSLWLFDLTTKKEARIFN